MGFELELLEDTQIPNISVEINEILEFIDDIFKIIRGLFDRDLLDKLNKIVSTDKTTQEKVKDILETLHEEYKKTQFKSRYENIKNKAILNSKALDRIKMAITEALEHSNRNIHKNELQAEEQAKKAAETVATKAAAATKTAEETALEKKKLKAIAEYKAEEEAYNGLLEDNELKPDDKTALEKAFKELKISENETD